MLPCGYKGDEPPPSNPLLRIYSSDDGPHEAAEHEWPWVVFLNFGTEKNLQATQAICGGSLISARYVLTAAHCLTVGGDHDDHRDADKVHVWLGAHDRDDDPSTVTYSSAEKVTLHPEYYKPTDRNYDVGLIRLTKTITMNNEMRPICLPSAEHFNMIRPGEDGTVVGWGLFEDAPNAAKILLRGTFPVVSRSDCWRSFRDKSAELGKSLGNLQLTDNMFCAGYEEDGFTTCRGDSGGAFMMEDGDQAYALGLVSFGLSVGCGRLITYTAYARLNEEIVNWIKRETSNLEEQ